MINQGKLFEQDFKNSIPVNVFFYRLRDGTGNFTGSKNEDNKCDAGKAEIVDKVCITFVKKESEVKKDG